MHASTGKIVLVYSAPFAVNDPTVPEGVREEQQINLSLKSPADDLEYQYVIPIGEGTIALSKLEQWQAEGKLVTVLSSSLRAIAFVHDNTKDKDGMPVKRYARPGRKVTVGKVTVETDAFVTFQAYDVRLAEEFGLQAEAEKAQGEFMKRRQVILQRQIQSRIEKAKQRVEERKSQVRQQSGQKRPA